MGNGENNIIAQRPDVVEEILVASGYLEKTEKGTFPTNKMIGWIVMDDLGALREHIDMHVKEPHGDGYAAKDDVLNLIDTCIQSARTTYGC